MASANLGPLTGGRFTQHGNRAGQIYYYDTIQRTQSYRIPPGFEDRDDVRIMFLQNHFSIVPLMPNLGHLGLRCNSRLAAMVCPTCST